MGPPLTLLFSTLLHAELLYKDSALQREEIVSLIKQGQVDAGLQNLRQLLMQQPDDQKLIADFVARIQIPSATHL